MEIEYILIADKRFGITKEKKYKDTTYVYLANLENPQEQLIRKYTDANTEDLLPLETDEEFDFALNLYAE